MTGARLRDRGPTSCPATRDQTPRGCGLPDGFILLSCDRTAGHVDEHRRHRFDGALDYRWAGGEDLVPATQGTAA